MRASFKAASMILSCLMVVGCGTVQTAPKPQVKHVSHKDGVIASMRLLHVPGQNADIDIYKMFYWSAGLTVEALVTEPKNPAPNDFPLYVVCHGGWIAPHPNWTHYPDYGSTPSFVAHDPPNAVYVFPEYRGYSESDGSVSGIYDNTVDTKNAIIAADSLKIVNPNFLTLQGESMGGAVALVLSSDATYEGSLHSVIAISPFVGWDVVGPWTLAHPNSFPRNIQLLKIAEQFYGPFSPGAPAYSKQSPNIANINAPVLLIQGTGDTLVDWNTVQAFYLDMKKYGKPAKLVLIRGGGHGLPNHQQEVYQIMESWENQFH